MEQKVFKLLREYEMLQDGDTVIVALSGGADSMALFHFFCANSGALGVRLAACHFEHGLRGAASRADADFVRDVCEKAAVPLYMEHGNMGAQKPPHGQSVEEWARKARYDFFERLAGRHGAKIATAHTLNDNAETVLFHAIRGAGPRGLAGIPPVRGPFVRPLLDVARAEVEAYCQANRLPWVEDATNAQPGPARNRLRLQVLPALEQVHPGAAKALARAARDMRGVDEHLGAEAQQLLARAGVETAYARGYSARLLCAAPQPVLLYALAQIAGPATTREQLAKLEALVRGWSKNDAAPAGVQLAGGIMVRSYRGLLVREAPVLPGACAYTMPLEAGRFDLPGGFSLQIDFLHALDKLAGKYEQAEKTDKKRLTFVADCDRIAKNSVLRTRQPGDVFAPRGRGGHRPLKKWMNEQGVPRSVRGAIPLLAHGNEVQWVYGASFAEGTAITPATQKVLAIRCETLF